MVKIGVCGHFGANKQFYDGQTVKTKILTEEIKNYLGKNEVLTVDTYNWRKNPFKLFIRCIYLFKNSDNILILPAHRGAKVFIPLFGIINKIYKKKIHYVVIGGWLHEFLKKNNYLVRYLRNFDSIIVETKILQNNLVKMGFNNVLIIPNFKRLEIISENEIKNNFSKPFPICTFSRVMIEKGIEDAINTVININKESDSLLFTLDIYGQIDPKYKEQFNKIMSSVPSYIKYKGKVPFDKSVEILKNYFLLLFPTHFYTEGIPGTIIDAYAAGVPVVSSAWQSADDIVDHDNTGWIYKFRDTGGLKETLINAADNPEKVTKMKKNCVKKAWNYHPENLIKELLERIIE